MLMPLALLNRRRRGFTAFSPSSLYSSGSQGIWLDPSDLTTMFSDRAGTIPVTTPGTVVGKRLDKSGRGNHATAPTDAARPTYGVEPKGGTRNRANGSASVGDAVYWGTTNLTAGVTTTKVGSGFDTDGLPYVDWRVTGTATANSGTSIYSISNSRVAATAGQTYTASFYLQLIAGTAPPAGSGIRSSILGENIGLAAVEFFGSATGTPATETLITVTGTLVNATTVTSRAAPEVVIVSGATYDYTVRIKAFQFELGTVRTAYQANKNAYDITESGVATCHYVQYDGSDDSMSTSAIDFTGTDKMSVFAGIRKLSDAAVIIAELGTDFNTQAGSMLLANGTPVGSGPNYCSGSRGTAAASTGQIGNSAASFAAPITSLVTALHDIAGDLSAIRVNGAASGTNATGDKGSGNFGNHSLFFGRRNNATAPFNGRDFGIVIVGKAASAGEITDTETWLAARTSGVSI